MTMLHIRFSAERCTWISEINSPSTALRIILKRAIFSNKELAFCLVELVSSVSYWKCLTFSPRYCFFFRFLTAMYQGYSEKNRNKTKENRKNSISAISLFCVQYYSVFLLRKLLRQFSAENAIPWLALTNRKSAVTANVKTETFNNPVHVHEIQ